MIVNMLTSSPSSYCYVICYVFVVYLCEYCL